MDCNKIGLNYVGQYADHHLNVHEISRRQSKTKSGVSIDEYFEAKYFQKYPVELYHCFSAVGC